MRIKHQAPWLFRSKRACPDDWNTIVRYSLSVCFSLMATEQAPWGDWEMPMPGPHSKPTKQHFWGEVPGYQHMFFTTPQTILMCSQDWKALTVSSQVTHRGASQVDFYNKSQRGFSESQDVLLAWKSRAQFGSWSGLRLDLPASVSDVFLGNGNEGRGRVLEHKAYRSWILFPQMELWVKCR